MMSFWSVIDIIISLHLTYSALISVSNLLLKYWVSELTKYVGWIYKFLRYILVLSDNEAAIKKSCTNIYCEFCK